MQQLEQMLNEWFGVKAPQLPMGLKNFIVAIAPYLTILGVLGGVMAVIALFGFGALGFGMMMGSYGMMGSYASSGFMLIVSAILIGATVILEAMAIPGLFKKSMSGWRLIFYTCLISVVSSVINGGIFGAIISAVICFYILFQVRPLYQ